MTDPTPADQPSDAPRSDAPAPAAPPPAAPTPAVPPPAAPPASRPVGKVRSAAAVIIFSIITLGIYFLYWTYQVFRELKEHTDQGIGPIIALVIAFVFNPINWFVLPSEIGNMYERAGQSKPVSGIYGLWILLPIIGFIIWTVQVQGALNRAWEGQVSV